MIGNIHIEPAKLYYLASPYSHKEPKVMTARYKHAVKCTAHFLHSGVFIYSPIVHNHNIVITWDLGREWKDWENYDFCMLDRCDGLLVLTMDGWESSTGVGQEMRRAIAHRKFSAFVDPTDFSLIQPTCV